MAYEITEKEDSGSAIVTFPVSKDAAEGFVNNKRDNFRFKFNKIFDQNAKQEEVFEYVAKPVLQNVLLGYNGTVFAYGQTGSGKTFTITGGAERYTDRGLIPRTISYLFQEYQKNVDSEYTTHVSYLEIYNQCGYDLLDPRHNASKLEDLPKVSLLEDNNSNIHLKNLSIHQANSEEEALNLLFLGDTNRMIAETPMNQASTRSHCIFTIHMSIRETGSDTIRRSKFHLVDLAGSERVAKSNIGGTILTEAKYINLSLHFLEQVIISLSEKSRTHIPYRNSMMTSVLRDSLGGNCMTSMIATCSVEKKNLDETITTCRFAQRVALIKNEALLNEEVDPKLMVVRLKSEIQRLKEELAIATGNQSTDPLVEQEIDRCRALVDSYIADSDPEAILSVGGDMRKITLCYKIFKDKVLQGGPSKSGDNTQGENEDDEMPVNSARTSKEVQRLTDLLQQRDNEINILVTMLKKEKQRAAVAVAHSKTKIESDTSPRDSRITQSKSLDTKQYHHEESRASYRKETKHERSPSNEKQAEPRHNRIYGDMSKGRQEAFDIFRRDYANNSAIDDKKRILKQKYAEAKAQGEALNDCKMQINNCKQQIEKYRIGKAMKGLNGREINSADLEDQEQFLRDKLQAEKSRYKDIFGHLKVLKTEIEHLQHLLDKARLKLQQDFEVWWQKQTQSQGIQQEQPVEPPPKSRSVWRTPTPNKHDYQPRSKEARSNERNAGSSRNSQEFMDSYTHGYSPKNKEVKSHERTANSSRNLHEILDSYTRSSEMTRKQIQQKSIPMTGDKEADADILAFMKAKQDLARARGLFGK
ncbi:uncharacterized protein TRIADDRAFT_61256 [Trichoplax adhaerens]|uniref:Kinesin-like protein n=1 Tax=Trichoplax adhaerens TaxID=10228 RepID=B3SAH0_TRIAD|nr:hypothetical protein TRIADDRAFT_61256 [Trichoplax adhaerens]EDV20258.1 hypothetical protein TRIADDRAFT_61256 [Trichoplax adhaerens]|eukprot:XP_002117208.1 hypothetical protein TRIADDRAFT_61256 [Trichoplax adhaerens]